MRKRVICTMIAESRLEYDKTVMEQAIAIEYFKIVELYPRQIPTFFSTEKAMNSIFGAVWLRCTLG